MAENTVVYQGTGRRKNAVARVRLVPGTGKVTINKRDAEQYFGRHQLVENALAPFKVTDTAGQFDVIALCDGGGISGQSGALRLGIARALLNAGDYRADLKKAGFLTRDARVVERKKYGLKKARRAPQFSKRSGFISFRDTMYKRGLPTARWVPLFFSTRVGGFVLPTWEGAILCPRTSSVPMASVASPTPIFRATSRFA